MKSPVTTLPVEVLLHIFQYVATLSEPLEAEARGRRVSFPFNLASTCSFWAEVLKLKPQYWHSVVIDLADDPTPFLDTFGLFQSGPIEVSIFSRTKDIPTQDRDSNKSDENKQRFLENSRAQKVFCRLEAHIVHCRRISFNLVYQSSLPPAAHFFTRDALRLRSLSLKCQIHDCDDDDSEFSNGSLYAWKRVSLPSLVVISVTGYTFMQLYRLGPQFVDEILASQMHVSITHFTLHNRGIQSIRSFEVFIKALSDIKYGHRLSLSDISLTFDPCANRARICGPLSMSILEFKSVSSDFIAAVFSWASVGVGHRAAEMQITFERCSIPPLEQISYPPRGIRLTCFDTPSDDSLDNAILAFSPRRIDILRCDGVTDAWIHRLGTNIKYTPQKCLLSLEVRDCDKFTPEAVLSLVKKHHEEVYDLGMIVKVTGQGPVLYEDDARRLRSINPCTRSYVSWDVRSEKSCII